VKKISCLILARGGSKGVPKKNIKPLLNKPLIGWVIDAAKQTKLIGDIWVSTDCKDISKISKEFGAKIINRPDHLSGDDSLDIDAFKHALDYLDDIDEIVHLRATTPVIIPSNIDSAIDYYFKNKNYCTSLRSGHKMTESIFKFFTIENEFFRPMTNTHFLGRQNVQSTYIPNGYVDIVKVETIKKLNSLHGDKILAFETETTIEIDSIEQFNFLEYKLMKERNLI
jgi:CMP-N,N'-diacetyllegionaminic acid synthase